MMLRLREPRPAFQSSSLSLLYSMPMRSPERRAFCSGVTEPLMFFSGARSLNREAAPIQRGLTSMLESLLNPVGRAGH